MTTTPATTVVLTGEQVAALAVPDLVPDPEPKHARTTDDPPVPAGPHRRAIALLRQELSDLEDQLEQAIVNEDRTAAQHTAYQRRRDEIEATMREYARTLELLERGEA